MSKKDKLGELFFKYRGILPIPFIIVVILLFRPSYPYGEIGDYLIDIVGILIIFLGEGIRIISVGNAPPKTSGRGNEMEAASLRTSGIYAYSRNPIYLGNFFIGFGFAVFVSKIWVIIAYLVFFTFEYSLIIKAESNFLQKKFGEEFEDWRKQVPAFFPSFKNNSYKNREVNEEFSWKRVIKREDDTITTFLLMTFAWEIWETLSIFNYASKRGKVNILIGVAVSILVIWSLTKVWKKNWF